MADLLTEVKDRVLYLTLNRPDKLNAMSGEMMGALVDNLSRAATNPEIGAVVLTGAGRGFCAGGDIGGMRARNEGAGAGEGAAQTIEDRVAGLRRGEEASLMLHEMSKATIAAVNGPAAGAGLSLAMACDIRIASDAARFGTAFAKVGFSGDYGGTWSLTHLVGSAKARELYFLADVIGADEALRIGLANRVVPARVVQRRGACDRVEDRQRPDDRLRLYESESQRGAESRVQRAARSRGVGPNDDRPHRGPSRGGEGVSGKASAYVQGAVARESSADSALSLSKERVRERCGLRRRHKFLTWNMRYAAVRFRHCTSPGDAAFHVFHWLMPTSPRTRRG